MDIIFLRQAHRFIRKADKPLREKIKEEVLRLQEYPALGKLLTGKMKTIRAHRFHFHRTGYRIAYRVQNNLLIIAIATRENFYRDLEI